MAIVPTKNGLVGQEAVIGRWEPRHLLWPVLQDLTEPVRKRAEQSIRAVVCRAREYDDLDREHSAKQREYDGNERILMALPGGANAPSFEATEMRRRQDALDTDLQGIETRLAGLAKVLGWPS